MLWSHKNIGARIWPNDHCPPHVTFVCRADHWTARMRFSMVMPAVALWDVKPLSHAPSIKLLNELAAQLHAHLDACRAEWWRTQQTVCLDNHMVFRAANGKVYLGAGPGAAHGMICAGVARYENAAVLARLCWTDGSFTVEEIQS